MPNDDVLPIVMCGDPVLRKPAQTVDPSNLAKPAMKRLIAQMRATMQAAPGVGLAAPQVGVPLRVAVLEDGPERWGQQSTEDLAARERTPLPFTVMVNPVLSPVDDAGEVAFYEGCLSVPSLTGVVKRHLRVRVDACSTNTASQFHGSTRVGPLVLPNTSSTTWPVSFTSTEYRPGRSRPATTTPGTGPGRPEQRPRPWASSCRPARWRRTGRVLADCGRRLGSPTGLADRARRPGSLRYGTSRHIEATVQGENSGAN